MVTFYQTLFLQPFASSFLFFCPVQRHGYINGKKGELVVDAPALANVTEQVINTCIDNPDRSVLSVMEEARQ